MRLLLIGVLFSFALDAQPLPVVSLQSTDLDQLVRNLRDKKPIPVSDCAALDLLECLPDDPMRITDLSIRWVQLDGDPELEAVLMVEAYAEGCSGYVFDKHGGWNRVASFFDHRCSVINDFIQVQKLTEKSPMMILAHVDLGGNGSVLLTTQVFQLRDGKVWPVMEINGKHWRSLPPPTRVLRQHVFSSINPDRLVIHTINEEPEGRVVKNECEVRRWDVTKHMFIAISNEKKEYCDPKTGKPIDGRSFWTGLPIYP